MSETDSKSSQNVTRAVPYLNVTDMPASVDFYVNGIGFQIINQWLSDGKLRWCWLELGGAAMMLQASITEGAHRNLPDVPLGIGVSIVFMCQDALAICHAIKDRGSDASAPVVGNGLWVATVRDPDGYRIEFESPTDVPEGTVYGGPEE